MGVARPDHDIVPSGARRVHVLKGATSDATWESGHSWRPFGVPINATQHRDILRREGVFLRVLVYA